MADLGIEVVRRGPEVALRLTGDLDASVYERVAAELRRLEGERPQVLVIDLSGLAFMDSTGARFLVEADGRARAEDRSLLVVAGTAGPRRVMDLLRLGDRLTIVDEAPGGAGAATA
jgi:anti-sigma B factor antagonist